jgi:hypothetical protein
MATVQLGDTNQPEVAIRDAIAAVARGDDEFVIVVRDNEQNYFAQAAPMQGNLFLLEYRDLYGQMAADEPIEAADLAALLIAYANGDDSWISRFAWAPVEI